MRKYIFKKDGKDNQSIIKKVIDYIKNVCSSTGKGYIIESDGNKIYPGKSTICLGWLFIDAFDSTGLQRNHILQFNINHYLPPCDKHAIWLSEDDSITFSEDKTSFIIERFNTKDKIVVREINND
jgi:hypothetical protein